MKTTKNKLKWYTKKEHIRSIKKDFKDRYGKEKGDRKMVVKLIKENDYETENTSDFKMVHT